MIFAGARLTQTAGILLRLPQDIIAQAIVIFTRFWIGPEGGSLREHDAQVSGETLPSTFPADTLLECLCRLFVPDDQTLRPP